MACGLERMEYNKASHCSDFWERVFDLTQTARFEGLEDKTTGGRSIVLQTLQRVRGAE